MRFSRQYEAEIICSVMLKFAPRSTDVTACEDIACILRVDCRLYWALQHGYVLIFVGLDMWLVIMDSYSEATPSIVCSIFLSKPHMLISVKPWLLLVNLPNYIRRPKGGYHNKVLALMEHSYFYLCDPLQRGFLIFWFFTSSNEQTLVCSRITSQFDTRKVINSDSS